MGITLIIVGLEKIISGIFERRGSKWGTVGLGVLALIFGSLAMGFPIGTGVFVIVMLGVGLLSLASLIWYMDLGIKEVLHGQEDLALVQVPWLLFYHSW